MKSLVSAFSGPAHYLWRAAQALDNYRDTDAKQHLPNPPLHQRMEKHKKCHLYRHYDKDGVLLYVGISLNALSRLAQHKNDAHWYNQVETVKIRSFSSKEIARQQERKAIILEKPKYNIIHMVR